MSAQSQPLGGDGAAQKACDKIRTVLGTDRGNEVITSTMRAAGLTAIDTADDRYRFGVELTKRGGLLEAIGRAVMVQALLQGAKAA